MSAETIGIIITIAVVVVTTAVRLEKRFNSLENRFSRLDNRLDNHLRDVRNGLNQVIRQSNGIVTLLAHMVGLLGEKEIISRQEESELLKNFVGIRHVGEVSPNPLSRQKVNKLNEYIRKAQRGGHFTRAEVLEYNEFVERLEEGKA